jgi:hypothetical protein
MDLKSLIDLAGGAASLNQLASTAGFSGQEMDLVVTAASPLLIKALHRQMKTPNWRNALRQLMRSGGPQQFIDRPFLLVANVGEVEGQQYLRQLLGSVGAVEAAASSISNASGIRKDAIEHVLPRLTSLFTGALCKKLGVTI